MPGINLKLDIPYLVQCESDNSTSINFYNWDASKFYYWDVSPGELGCWCSHYKLWLEASKNKENIIIFEDDMFPLDVKTFKNNVINFIEHLPESFDIAFMDLSKIVFGDIIALEDNNFVSKPSERFKAFGGQAYLLSEKGANKLLNYEAFNKIEDVFIWDRFNEGDLEIYISSLDFIGVGREWSILNEMGR